MKAKFRMFRRGNVFWCQDNVTGKQETLRTKDRETALRLLHARMNVEPSVAAGAKAWPMRVPFKNGGRMPDKNFYPTGGR